jgi:hypothetical protein
MSPWSLMVGLLAVTCAAANAQACDSDPCRSLVVAAAANPFDGNWRETITNEGGAPNCSGTLSTSFSIANGRVVQEGTRGTVSPNGSARGTGSGPGYTSTWTGHFSGNSASGRFKRNDGCVGRWEATRQ